MEHLLEQLGLTTLEIKIYRSLLNEGASMAGKLSTRTGIHRRNVYDALSRLIQKGLVAYIKENNRNHYAITDPRNIPAMLQRQQNEWETLMPAMIAHYQAATANKETLFYRGKRAIREVLLDQVEQQNEILVNATSLEVQEILTHFFSRYALLRKERKIKSRMIFDLSFQTKKNEVLISKMPLCTARFLKNFNSSSMSQYIYGTTVSLIVWSEDPIAIMIRDPQIAQGFRDRFNLLWSLADQ